MSFPDITSKTQSALLEPEADASRGASESLLPERFEQALARAGRMRRLGAAADDAADRGALPLFGAEPQRSAHALADAAAPAPNLSAVEFAATLERLQAPLPAASTPAQWEFGLDAQHAPLAAVRVVEGERGGWNVMLVAAPRDRPALQAHIERLRLRLVGRGAPVASLAVDEAER